MKNKHLLDNPIQNTGIADPKFKTCPHGFKLNQGEGYPRKCPLCKEQADIFKKIGV